MLIFKSFSIGDIEAINEFLSANSDKLTSNGIHYHQGSVCFLTTDTKKSDAENLKTGLLAALGEMIANQYVKY